MKVFRKNNKFGDRRGGGVFGGKRDFSRPGFNGNKFNRGNERGQMHQATCSECGNKCEVPFRPTGEKPVYCKECFSGTPYDQSKNFTRKEFAQPREERSSQSHHQFIPAPDRRIDELKKQLEMVDVKLDRLIRTLEAAKHGEEIEEVEAPKLVKKATVKKSAKKVAPKKK